MCFFSWSVAPSFLSWSVRKKYLHSVFSKTKHPLFLAKSLWSAPIRSLFEKHTLLCCSLNLPVTFVWIPPLIPFTCFVCFSHSILLVVRLSPLTISISSLSSQRNFRIGFHNEFSLLPFPVFYLASCSLPLNTHIVLVLNLGLSVIASHTLRFSSPNPPRLPTRLTLCSAASVSSQLYLAVSVSTSPSPSSIYVNFASADHCAMEDRWRDWYTHTLSHFVKHLSPATRFWSSR